LGRKCGAKPTLNSKTKYRVLKEKTTKCCFVNCGFEYQLYSDCIRVQKQNTSTKQTKLLWVPLFFGFEYRKLDLNPATKHALYFLGGFLILMILLILMMTRKSDVLINNVA
jgi:hypothetical protein